MRRIRKVDLQLRGGSFCGTDDTAKSLAHETRRVAKVINVGMAEQKNRVDTFREEGERFPI